MRRMGVRHRRICRAPIIIINQSRVSQKGPRRVPLLFHGWLLTVPCHLSSASWRTTGDAPED